MTSSSLSPNCSFPKMGMTHSVQKSLGPGSCSLRTIETQRLWGTVLEFSAGCLRCQLAVHRVTGFLELCPYSLPAWPQGAQSVSWNHRVRRLGSLRVTPDGAVTNDKGSRGHTCRHHPSGTEQPPDTACLEEDTPTPVLFLPVTHHLNLSRRRQQTNPNGELVHK